MLTFYPEFEADEITENEIIFMLDLSNSMKVHTTTQNQSVKQLIKGSRPSP